MLHFGFRKQEDSIDTLTQAMGRAIRVNGAPTRDGQFKQSVQTLLEQLEVVSRKSHNVSSPDLDSLMASVQNLTKRIEVLRQREGF